MTEAKSEAREWNQRCARCRHWGAERAYNLCEGQQCRSVRNTQAKADQSGGSSRRRPRALATRVLLELQPQLLGSDKWKLIERERE